MTEQPQADLLTLFYTAVSAVHDGKIDSAEVSQTVTTPDGSELCLNVLVERTTHTAEV